VAVHRFVQPGHSQVKPEAKSLSVLSFAGGSDRNSVRYSKVRILTAERACYLDPRSRKASHRRPGQI
jgi:hypothetical protein